MKKIGTLAKGGADARPNTSDEGAEKILHELRVHQIELELQNEELRRAQVELDAARARYFDLFDLAPVGYLALNGSGVLTEVNLTLSNLLGVARSRLVDQPLHRFVHREDQHLLEQVRRQVLELGQAPPIELRLQKSDGTPLWVRIETARGRGIDGAYCCRAAVSDISALRQAAAESDQLQAQLLQAQKMDAVGQLAGGIAHDFNNILAAMTLELDVLGRRDVVPPPELRETVTRLLDSARRAAQLTRQLLLFSRRQPMRLSLHDLNAVVRELSKLLERLLGEQVALTLELSADPLWIECDATMIGQVITNLCINGRDAMPNGGRLTIKTEAVTIDAGAARGRPDARSGSFVRLSVTDAGMGMAPEVIEHLFEPFFTTKALGKGTGLGLATAHGIVAKHGGWIEVRSAVGHGTTMANHFRAAPAPNVEESAPAVASVRGGHERILLVEDEPAVRRVAADCLRGLGYRVVEAAHGADALKIWDQERAGFDLVFTDIVMPGGIGGLQLWKALSERKAGLKTVFTSGNSAESVRDEIGPRSDVAHLQKPYDLVTLAATIRACLDGTP